MKKLYLIFIALSLTILFLGCGNKKEEPRYSSTSDKDIIESLGPNGQFAIHKVVYKNKSCLNFYDDKNNKRIDIIDDYIKIKPYIYTKGKKGYTMLNYEDGSAIQADHLSAFSDEDKEIFNDLE